MTAEIAYKEQVLDAIDHLRKRKARPDENRIFNLLARRSALSYSDAKLALEKCIEIGAVIRVDYKGGTSYRNAAKKYSHLKRDSQGEVIREPSTKFTGLLTKAITEFVLEEPDYLECGVPGAELIENILSKDSVRYNEGYVRILLDKEVASGSLIKMDHDRFLVGPAKTNNQRLLDQNTVVSYEDDVMSDVNPPISDTSDSISETKARKKPGPKPGFKKDRILDSFSSTKKEDNAKRMTGRRKRAKKVFDPSDNNLPKKRGRPLGSLNKTTLERQAARSSDNDSRPASRTSSSSYRDQGGVCGLCHCNKRDRMVSCRDCNGKAHLSCLNGEDTASPLYPDNSWQCFECKTCVVCHATGRAESIAVCGICTDGYHLSCLSSAAERPKSGMKWHCKKCKVLDQISIKDIHIGFEGAQKDEGMSSPSNSGNSSIEHYRTPPMTPTPPTLSPQEHLNGHRVPSPTFSIKSEDSPSCKDMDVEENIDPSIPDATYWTHDDVYNYFAQYFPEEEAKVFKEQEIDGRSLLLMKRSDVVRNLNLKLGPAVKMYKHVVTLQLRRDVPRLYLL